MSKITALEKQESAVAIFVEQRQLTYGSVIPIAVFEELFSSSRHDKAFNWLVSKFRTVLSRNHGMYLSGEGLEETGVYSILRPEENRWVAKNAMERAERDLETKLLLLVHTDRSKMSELDKRRHEVVQRQLSARVEAIEKLKRTNARFVKFKSEPELKDSEEDSETP